MNEYIKSDLFRYTGKVTFFGAVQEYIRNSTFRYMVAIRLYQSKGFEKTVGALLCVFNLNKDIRIPKRTQIGYGLYIGHNGPIVINDTAKIGNNCNLLSIPVPVTPAVRS